MQSFLHDIGDEEVSHDERQDVTKPPTEGEPVAESATVVHPPDESPATNDETDKEKIEGTSPQQSPTNHITAEETSDPHGEQGDQGPPPNQEQLSHSMEENTPLGTPPHKLHPSSPPTSTGSGSPAGSIAGSVRGRRMSKAIAGKIQKEFESREKKLKHDLDEVKAKSRKAVTSLKAQLAEANSRHADDMESVKQQLEELRENLENVQRENTSLMEQAENVKLENSDLAAKLGEREEEVNKYKTLADELQQRLDAFQSDFGKSTLTKDDNDVQQQSPQWSNQSEQLTPRSVGVAPQLYEQTPPLLPMDEVFHSGDEQSLTSGSVVVPIPDGRGVQFLATPLDQSMNSAINHAPLGSPLQSASLVSDGGSMRGGAVPIPVQYSLGMLAQSRLSHHSPGPQVRCVCVCVCVSLRIIIIAHVHPISLP